MIGLLGGALEQSQTHMTILLLLSAKLEVLNDTQSTFLAESCMIGLLGGVLEQNQPTLAILLLLCQVGGTE